MTEEIGWLIESRHPYHKVPTWWGVDSHGLVGWTTDHLKAIRYARKEDGERVVSYEGMSKVIVCEHAWS